MLEPDDIKRLVGDLYLRLCQLEKELREYKEQLATFVSTSTPSPSPEPEPPQEK